jgi:hypothetical protein
MLIMILILTHIQCAPFPNPSPWYTTESPSFSVFWWKNDKTNKNGTFSDIEMRANKPLRHCQ